MRAMPQIMRALKRQLSKGEVELDEALSLLAPDPVVVEADCDELAGPSSGLDRRPFLAPGVRAEALPKTARLYSSRRVQRLVPHRLAVAAGWLRGRLWWHTQGKRREKALRDMRQLLSGVGREREARIAARDHLVEVSVKQLIPWRPWMFDGATVGGLEHLNRAVARGGGAVLVSVHLGPYSVRPLALRGHRLNVVLDRQAFRQPFLGVAGLRRLTILRNVLEVGGTPIGPPRAYEQLKAALERGEVAALSFDVPGSHSTPFAGRRAHVRTGAARLALATGAPLVPGLVRRRGHRLHVQLHPPMVPEDFAGVDELIAYLADLFAKEILARPGEYTSASFLRRLG